MVLFQPERTEEERAKGKYVHKTLRLNIIELSVLDELKRWFDVKSDGTMIKMALMNYHRVLQSNFSPRYIQYLFKKERHRLSDYKPIVDQNVTQKERFFIDQGDTNQTRGHD